MSRRTPRRSSARQYPRTARLNQLLREILGDELERIDDDRLELVTLTEVTVEGDLRHAAVFYDSLDGEESDPQVLEAFAEHRVRLQGAIGRQARMKRTPELSFSPDRGVRSGERIEDLLRDIDVPGDAEAEAEAPSQDPAGP